MSGNVPRDDEFAARLPLPLAQLYRRASNAKTALDRHHHAYYLAEATLKLTACARIGAALASGLEARSTLARSLEQLCLPSVGHWVGFVREAAEYLRGRPDAGLLPLAGTHEALLRHEALPAVRAFAERAAARGSDDSAPISADEARAAARQGILGFFSCIAAYRNQVFGHGAQRVAAFYDELGPLLLDAACEVLEKGCLFGGMTLAVARLAPDPSGRHPGIEWQGLKGLGSFTLAREAAGPEVEAIRATPGEVYLIAPGARVTLHPLVVYQEDRSERERVGFLNRTLLRREGEEVRRVEHLDYATGDLLSGFDAREALAALLGRLRGQPAKPSDVDRLIDASQAEPHEVTAPVLGAGATIGDFDLEGEIGRGGMGVVYRARQRSLNRLVALKVLPPALAADPVALARFRREIAALARSEHPHLVKIITSGSDGDRHFFAMELVEGVNLADLFDVLSTWRREGGEPLREGHLAAAVSSSSELAEQRRSADRDPLPEVQRIEPGPPPRVGEGGALYLRLAELFADAVDAVAHLHSRGILHRDLKPANLMLTADGRRLVVMDLGVAQVRDRSQSLTRTAARWVGTLRYSAPEQLQRNLLDVDERADVYGLGATLYELVTLAPLFDGDTEPRLIEQVLHQEPRQPQRIDPAIPRDLAAIITTCLDKDRTRRYANARDLAEDLRRFKNGLPVRVRPLGTAQRLWRWCRRNRALAAASALAIAALLAVAAVSSALAVKERRTALDFQRRVAESDLTRGQILCEEGDIARGMHWMVRALEETPAGDGDLERAIRTNLGGWSRRWVPPQAVIQAPGGEPALAFSPGGKRVLMGSYAGTARLCSAETGDPIGRPMDTGLPVTTVAFSPNGRDVATGSRNARTARLWSGETGEPLSPPLEHGGAVTTVAFSPDGKFLLTGSGDATARFWSAETGSPAGRPLQHGGAVRTISFSPEGTRVATGSDDGTARLWSMESREPIGSPLRHERAVVAAKFSPDGKRVLTGSEDATARFWSADTGEALGPPLQHAGPIHAVAFSPDGKWAATGSADKWARLWSVDRAAPHGLPLEHRGTVNDVTFSPDGTRVATASSDYTSRIWSVDTGEALGEPLKHDNTIYQIAFNSTGNLLATGSADETVRIWPAQTFEPPHRILRHDHGVWSVAFSPNGKRLLTGSEDTTTRLWSTETGDPVGPPWLLPGTVWTVAFSPDGKRAATGDGEKAARIWSVETHEPLGPPLRHEDVVREVAFSPDSKWVLTGSFDGTARLWSADTGEPVGPPLRHEGMVEDVAFSPDGKLLLTGSGDKTARLWSAATQEPFGRPILHRGAVLAVAFTPDGKRFLTGGRDNVVRFWSVKDGSPAGPKIEHRNWVEDLAVSPDGSLLVTGCVDQTARLWSAATGRLRASYWKHRGSIQSVAISSDGKRVATASMDKTARIWDIPSPITGDKERLRLWTEAITGLEMDADGVILWLDPAAWRERRSRLEALGGPPGR